jgi:hypothetical protein
MIVFVRDDCTDCKRFVDYVIDNRLAAEIVDGENLLKGHINGTDKRFTKLEIVDMLAAMAMQDDEFPVVKIGENFVGKKELTQTYGVTFNG